MSIQASKILLAGLILFLLIACDSKPKVIESQSAKAAISANSIPALKEISGVNPTSTAPSKASEHTVKVEEILNTEKYTYLQVSEEGKKHWIAIPRSDITVGETYHYSGGLLKRNFFSKEYDRVFETIYLVSKIWKGTKKTTAGSALEEAVARTKAGAALNIQVGKVKPAEGAITIKELFENKEKYNGQTVKITGQCVKVNPKIMNRNWVHLQDGSEEALDLTITTQQDIPLGAVLTLEGVIALDKDFGAGYRYDLIMEGAEMK